MIIKGKRTVEADEENPRISMIINNKSKTKRKNFCWWKSF